MPKKTVFVVSALGQDIFYDGFSDVTQNIYGAFVYNTFVQAELGSQEATFGSPGVNWGIFEVRTILYTY
jgi:hypothetical protein